MGHNTQLRDSWNWLDFIVVILGWADAIGIGYKLSVLRGVRAFRPLRTCRSKPLRDMVAAISKSFFALLNAFLFQFFIFLVFSIIGVQLYKGNWDQRCRIDPAPSNGQWAIEPDQHYLCGADLKCFSGYCPTKKELTSGEYTLEMHKQLLKANHQTAALNFGVTNFDNVFNSFFTIFHIVTLEGWSSTLYMMQDVGNDFGAIMFMFVLLMLGHFQCLNMMLAILSDSVGSTLAT